MAGRLERYVVLGFLPPPHCCAAGVQLEREYGPRRRNMHAVLRQGNAQFKARQRQQQRQQRQQQPAVGADSAPAAAGTAA